MKAPSKDSLKNVVSDAKNLPAPSKRSDGVFKMPALPPRVKRPRYPPVMSRRVDRIAPCTRVDDPSPPPLVPLPHPSVRVHINATNFINVHPYTWLRFLICSLPAEVKNTLEPLLENIAPTDRKWVTVDPKLFNIINDSIKISGCASDERATLAELIWTKCHAEASIAMVTWHTGEQLNQITGSQLAEALQPMVAEARPRRVPSPVIARP